MQGTDCESEAMRCSDKTIHSYNQGNQYIWEVWPPFPYHNTEEPMSHATTQHGVCTHKRGMVLHWPATHTTAWRKAVLLWKLCLHRIEA